MIVDYWWWHYMLPKTTMVKYTRVTNDNHCDVKNKYDDDDNHQRWKNKAHWRSIGESDDNDTLGKIVMVMG
jgi:hypothetical protein